MHLKPGCRSQVSTKLHLDAVVSIEEFKSMALHQRLAVESPGAQYVRWYDRSILSTWYLQLHQPGGAQQFGVIWKYRLWVLVAPQSRISWSWTQTVDQLTVNTSRTIHLTSPGKRGNENMHIFFIRRILLRKVESPRCRLAVWSLPGLSYNIRLLMRRAPHKPMLNR